MYNCKFLEKFRECQEGKNIKESTVHGALVYSQTTHFSFARSVNFRSSLTSLCLNFLTYKNGDQIISIEIIYYFYCCYILKKIREANEKENPFQFQNPTL